MALVKKYQLFRTNKDILRTGCSTIPKNTVGIVYERKRDKKTLWVWLEYTGGGMFFDVDDITPVPKDELPLLMNRHEFIDEALSIAFKK
jgi:hypothetical protein